MDKVFSGDIIYYNLLEHRTKGGREEREGQLVTDWYPGVYWC